MAKRKSIKSVWRFLFHDAPTNTNETPYAGGNGSRTLMVYLSWSINEWTRKRYSLNEHAACMHATIDVDSNATKKIDVRQRIAILFDSGGTHSGPNVSTPHVCESFRMDCVGLLGSYYCFRCDCVIRFRRNVAPNNHGRSSHIPQQRQPPRDAHAVSVLCVRHQEINHFTSSTNCCYVCTGERCNTRTNAVDETNEQREIKWTKRNCLFGKEISW